MERHPTLVPTFRAVARSIVDDPAAEEIALAIDHQLYRESERFSDHVLAWGVLLCAQSALAQASWGTPGPLTKERVEAMLALPAAALTVVVLRDGAGFGEDAIADEIEQMFSA